MKNALPLSLLLAAFIVSCSTDEDRMRARLEALPELPAAIAEQLDSTTMAVRAPVIGKLPEVELIADPSLAPCCSIKVTKRLKVLFETTWCDYPWDAPILNAKPDRPGHDDAANTTGVRHSKLTSLNGQALTQALWCQTSSGPWDAELVSDHSCFSSGPIFTLVVSTPHGLISFPPWVGGEANKPASVTVVECKLVSTIRSHCNNVSNCECLSSFCIPPEQCGCPLF